MKSFFCLLFFVMSIATGRMFSCAAQELDAVVVKVTEPGTLSQKLWEMEGTVSHLVIQGALNADDLRYIADGDGAIADVEVLDLTGVTLIPGGEYYAKFNLSYEGAGATGYFYLSAENKSEVVSSGNWLGIPTGSIAFSGDCFGGVFDSLTKLKTVKFPEYMTEIGAYTLSNCPALEKVVMGDKITKICEGAFFQSGIKNISFTSPVSIIGSRAFLRSKLETISVPSTVDSIGAYAFQQSNLCDIDISRVTKLGYSAFRSTKLTKVTLADGLTFIDNYMFSNCNLLESVTIPASVRSVGRGAFVGTAWIRNHPGEGGVIYINNIAYKLKAKNVGSVLNIKDGTTIINEDFCEQNEGDIPVPSFNVVLPSSVKEIGANAFSSITKLKKIEWPDEGLEVIRRGAFSGCTNFVFSSLPNSLREIGSTQFGGGAFRGCKSIVKLNLGPNLQKIEFEAFRDCFGITEVEIHTPNLYAGSIFGENTSIRKVVIGKEVEVVPNRFLNGCKMLEDVVFEDRNEQSTIVLSDDSFGRQNNLVFITNFPKGITYIGDYVFRNAFLNYEIDLSQVEYIGSMAFDGADVLYPLVLPASLKRVGSYAFAFCNEIKTVKFDAINCESAAKCFCNYEGNEFIGLIANNSLTKAIIGKDVEVLPNGLFSYCVNLESIEFEERDPKNAKPLEIKWRIVGDGNGCSEAYVSKVTDWVLPNGTTKISCLAFDSSIRFLELPETFTEFTGNGSSYVYKNLKKIICHAVDVPANFRLLKFNSSYSSERLEDVDVYVPAQSVEAYKADTEGWGRCNIYPLNSGADDILGTAADEIVSIHTLLGVQVPECDLDNLSSGLYLVRYKSGRTEKVAIP